MSTDDLKSRTDVAVVIADEGGLITYVNDRFGSLFGYRDDEIIGKPLTVIIPKSLRDSHQLGFSRFLMTGKPTLLDQPITLTSVTKGGGEFIAEHVISADKVGNRWVFGATIRPL